MLAENLGFAAGMNRGLERLAESADYLCVLNNDIEADPGFIDPLIDDLEGEAQRGAASPRIHYHAARDLIWYAGGHVGRLTRVAWHRGIRRRAEGRWLEAADTGYLTGCCIMGRSEFWRMTQGFDPIFGMYAEDVDLSLRAQALGWKLRYQPDSLIYHRIGHSSGGGLGPAKLRAQQRAVRRLIQRHVRPAARPLAYLAWALRTFHAAVAALARGERGVFAALLRSVGPGPGAKS